MNIAETCTCTHTRTQLNQRPLCCTSTHAAGVSSAKREVDILRAAVDWDIVTSDKWYFNMTTTLELKWTASLATLLGQRGRRKGAPSHQLGPKSSPLTDVAILCACAAPLGAPWRAMVQMIKVGSFSYKSLTTTLDPTGEKGPAQQNEDCCNSSGQPPWNFDHSARSEHEQPDGVFQWCRNFGNGHAFGAWKWYVVVFQYAL